GVPGTADDAHFDGSGTADCYLAGDVDINSIAAAAGFTGTIHQGVVPLTLAAALDMQDGTFSGGSASITLGGDFVVGSSAAFTSTSAVLSVSGNFTLNGTFSDNSGHVLLLIAQSAQATKTISMGTGKVFNDMELKTTWTGGNAQMNFDENLTLTVNGDLTLSGTGEQQLIHGQLDVKGNITQSNTNSQAGGGSTLIVATGAANQTITGSTSRDHGAIPKLKLDKTGGTVTFKNTVVISQTWDHQAATLDAETHDAWLVFRPGGVSVNVHGDFTMHNLEFYATSNFNQIYLDVGASVTATGDVVFSGHRGLKLFRGTVYAQGDVTVTNSGTTVGTTILRLNGTSDQTFDGQSAPQKGRMSYVRVDKPSGTLYLKGTISCRRDWTYYQGEVDATTHQSKVIFMCHSNAPEINTENNGQTMRFYDVEIDGPSNNDVAAVELHSPLLVDHDLPIGNGDVLETQGYELEVGGDWNVSGTFNEGTGTVTFNGTAAQSITHPAGAAFYDLTLTGNSTKTLGSNVTVGHALTLQFADMDLGAHNLVITNTALDAVMVDGGAITTSGAGMLQQHTASTAAYALPLSGQLAADKPFTALQLVADQATAQAYQAMVQQGETLMFRPVNSPAAATNIDLVAVNHSGYDLHLQVSLNGSGTITGISRFNNLTNGFETIPGADYSISGNILTLFSLSTQHDQANGGLVSAGGTELNWVHSITYGQGLAKTGETKQYLDGLGRSVQDLNRNLTTGQVIASQTVYDAYGRPAIQTLPAPSGSSLHYRDEFFQDAVNQDPYDYNYFDTPGTLNNPALVDQSVNNTLGYYYSNNNSAEPYVATTDYPYARTEYSADPMARPKRSTKPGNEFRFGNANNTEVRSFAFWAVGELAVVYGSTLHKVSIGASNRLENTPLSGSAIPARKQVSVNEQGQVSVAYVTADGQVLATARSGLGTSCTTQVARNPIDLAASQMTGVHLPVANQASLKLPAPQYFNGSASVNIPDPSHHYRVTDLETNTVLTEGTDYTIDAVTRKVTWSLSSPRDRFLRIAVVIEPNFEAAVLDDASQYFEPLTVEHELDYSYWTLHYYDLAGNLRKVVSPKDAACDGSGTHATATTYDYSPLGQMIAQSTPDEGVTQFLYDDEGKLRFAQDAQQKLDDEFGYIVYDAHGRAVESGEYRTVSGSLYFENHYQDPPMTAGAASVHTILNQQDGVDDANCHERSFTYYDLLASADALPAGWTHLNSYVPHYTRGQVAKTRNDETETWYSYDQFGRPEHTVQRFLDAVYTTALPAVDDQLKTVDYTYDLETGAFSTKVYQANMTAEKLTHQYSYDADIRLNGVTVQDGSAATVAEAGYTYYPTGLLKRKELGGDLQGIDYVYTITGQLKSINHPSLNTSKDPGGDANGSSTFLPDVFGMALDYHQNDYVRSGTDILYTATTAAASNFHGLVNATRWKTTSSYSTLADRISATGEVLTPNATDELMMQYTYDGRNQLVAADFGVYAHTTTNPATNTFTAHANQAYRVSGLTYDNNGNLNTLTRNGYDRNYPGTPNVAMDQLVYAYTANTNQLASIQDISGTAASAYGTDLDAATAQTFTYDAAGRVTASPVDNVTNVAYYGNGRTKTVTFGSSPATTAAYFYNDRQQKSRQQFTNTSGQVHTTWYVREASGQTIAILEREIPAGLWSDLRGEGLIRADAPLPSETLHAS
ncbi:MAG: DUF6443 domain-containing protein, partial [Bacteroidota bacterium]